MRIQLRKSWDNLTSVSTTLQSGRDTSLTLQNLKLRIYFIMASKTRVFNALEKKCFVDILKKYSTILENKETAGSSLKNKNEAWDKIAAEFNASPHAVSQVSNKQLRRLWMNLKQRQRESLTKERQHRLATEGGPSTSDVDIDPDVSSIAPALKVGINTAID